MYLRLGTKGRVTSRGKNFDSEHSLAQSAQTIFPVRILGNATRILGLRLLRREHVNVASPRGPKIRFVGFVRAGPAPTIFSGFLLSYQARTGHTSGDEIPISSLLEKFFAFEGFSRGTRAWVESRPDRKSLSRSCGKESGRLHSLRN